MGNGRRPLVAAKRMSGLERLSSLKALAFLSFGLLAPRGALGVLFRQTPPQHECSCDCCSVAHRMPAEMEIGATNVKCVYDAAREGYAGKAPCPDQCHLGT